MNSAQCDDGNACNGAETCSGGRCQGGTPLMCDDGNACNGAETCDPRGGCQRGTVDVRIEATSVAGSMIDPILQLVGTSCASTGVLACNDDQRNGTTASRLWIRSSATTAATRTVIVAVDSFSATAVGAFSLTVTAQMPAPAGTCNVGRFDVSQGGTVYHIVPAQMGTFTGSCSPGGYTVLGEQAYVYSGTTAMGAAITAGATGFRPMITVRDPMNCGNERGCAYNGMNSVVLNTTQSSGTILVDGILNMGTAFYRYALEFKP